LYRPKTSPGRIAIVVVGLPAGLCLLYLLLATLSRMVTFHQNVSYDMSWTIGEGTIPGRSLPETRHNEPKIVFTRRMKEIVCYDVVYSRPLSVYLNSHAANPLPVTYQLTRHFGRTVWVQLMKVGDYSEGGYGDSQGLPFVLDVDEYRGQSGAGWCFPR
jgi:hypothetical protein